MSAGHVIQFVTCARLADGELSSTLGRLRAFRIPAAHASRRTGTDISDTIGEPCIFGGRLKVTAVFTTGAGVVDRRNSSGRFLRVDKRATLIHVSSAMRKLTANTAERQDALLTV